MLRHRAAGSVLSPPGAQHGLTPVSQELGGNLQLVAGTGRGGAASARWKGFVGRTAWTSAAVVGFSD